jgi:hypothetical protein
VGKWYSAEGGKRSVNVCWRTGELASWRVGELNNFQLLIINFQLIQHPASSIKH